MRRVFVCVCECVCVRVIVCGYVSASIVRVLSQEITGTAFSHGHRMFLKSTRTVTKNEFPLGCV